MAAARAIAAACFGWKAAAADAVAGALAGDFLATAATISGAIAGAFARAAWMMGAIALVADSGKLLMAAALERVPHRAADSLGAVLEADAEAREFAKAEL